MIPPVFPLLKNDNAVTALLGAKPLRVYPWSNAPQNSARPYATYGVFNGNPDNTLDGAPQIDQLGTQIDIWADTVKSCQDCFAVVRDALELHGHMISFQSASRDEETQLFTARLEFDFWEDR